MYAVPVCSAKKNRGRLQQILQSLFHQRGEVERPEATAMQHQADAELSCIPYATPVSIGDVKGVFIRGAYVYKSPDATANKWDASADSYALSWKEGEMAFSINFPGGAGIPLISLVELVSIAKSMK